MRKYFLAITLLTLTTCSKVSILDTDGISEWRQHYCRTRLDSARTHTDTLLVYFVHPSANDYRDCLDTFQKLKDKKLQ